MIFQNQYEKELYDKYNAAKNVPAKQPATPDPEPTSAAPVQAENADVVVRPAHYTRWVIEPITFIMRNGMEFWRGNIIKYIARAGEKQYDGLDKVQSEITDLRKAARYCEIRINQLQGKGDSEL